MEHISPRALSPGDTIGIFTPSTPAYTLYPQKYAHALEQLRALGFKVVEGALARARKSQGYRSGSPRERAAELMELISDPDIRCVMSSLGGTASASLIPYLDFAEIRRQAKIICGFSDVTALHLAILKHSGLRTFYGPALVRSFGEWPVPVSETVTSFLDALQNHRSGPRQLEMPKRWSDQKGAWEAGQWNLEARSFRAQPGWKTLVAGAARAPVIVANLNTLVRAAGTEIFPELRGRILIIEEMNARLSKEERNLRQLERIGSFDLISGLIVSKPEHFEREGAPFGYDELILEVLQDPFARRGPFPVVTGFDCGHTQPMITLGQLAVVRVEARSVEFAKIWIDEPMVLAD